MGGGLLVAAFTYMQKFVVNDQYLVDLGVLVIGYGMAINLIEVTWKSRLKLQYPEANDYASFMGKYSTATGGFTILLMVVGQRFLKWFGWGVTAVCTPVVCLLTGICFFSLILFPAMWDPVAVGMGVDALMLSVLVGT